MVIAAQEKSLGALCVQKNEEGKEISLCYLSRTLVGDELKNSPPITHLCHSKDKALHASLYDIGDL